MRKKEKKEIGGNCNLKVIIRFCIIKGEEGSDLDVEIWKIFEFETIIIYIDRLKNKSCLLISKHCKINYTNLNNSKSSSKYNTHLYRIILFMNWSRPWTKRPKNKQENVSVTVSQRSPKVPKITKTFFCHVYPKNKTRRNNLQNT